MDFRDSLLGGVNLCVGHKKNRHQLPTKCFNYGLQTAAAAFSAGLKPFLALGIGIWTLPLNFNADLEAYLIWVHRFAQGHTGHTSHPMSV